MKTFLLITASITALYNSLNPSGLSEAMAFYELYPDSAEGKLALQRLASLLHVNDTEIFSSLINPLHQLQGGTKGWTEQEIQAIESLANHLPNHRLKGYAIQSEEEVLALASEEIDLGKALIFSQMRAAALGKEETLLHVRTYSALLDLMALQILAYLPERATPLQKIQATNRLIFEQMRFRFPPQSIYAEQIDLYTFLPSV
ncbi:MAG: hypothetical protein HY324_03370, partial [Chlamydiia bacterium]|nr:hypothetical protein [Chlamydiia bacterium]